MRGAPGVRRFAVDNTPRLVLGAALLVVGAVTAPLGAHLVVVTSGVGRATSLLAAVCLLVGPLGVFLLVRPLTGGWNEHFELGVRGITHTRWTGWRFFVWTDIRYFELRTRVPQAQSRQAPLRRRLGGALTCTVWFADGRRLSFTSATDRAEELAAVIRRYCPNAPSRNAVHPARQRLALVGFVVFALGAATAVIYLQLP